MISGSITNLSRSYGRKIAVGVGSRRGRVKGRVATPVNSGFNRLLHDHSLKLGRSCRPLSTWMNGMFFVEQQQYHYQDLRLRTRRIGICSGRRQISSATTDRIVQKMVDRHSELLQVMEESPNEAYRHGKELSALQRVVTLHQKYNAIDEEIQSLYELLEETEDMEIGGGGDSSSSSSSGVDAELQKECEDEIERLKSSKERIEKHLQHAILPRDDDDYESDAIIEIRAGTGGDEATLFSSELRDVYEKTSLSMSFKVEVLSETRTDLGGIKESVLSVSSRGGGGGMYDVDDDDDENDNEEDNTTEQRLLKMTSMMGPYGFFKYESGVHRVQRVPVNDTKMQTSACSVAVLPTLQEGASSSSSTQLLPASEIKIETMRSSGAGGQHVNTTDSAVRVTHIPTGITASIQDQRSQHKNKEKALKLIAARVRNAQREEQERQLGETRSSLLGGGDRSERIRTYNFPQDRVTDHRCKHSSHGISKMFGGGKEDGLVSAFWPYLQAIVQEEQLAALEEQEDTS